MKKLLHIFVITLLVFSGIFLLPKAGAVDSDTKVSDFVLDIQEGEKGTANDIDAQNAQQEVLQDEESQAAADDGDVSTEPVEVALDEMVHPEEVQESAKLVENPEATTSENDNGEVLKDQSIQTPQEKPNEDVNTKDDNKAPVTDPDTKPQASQAPEEQPLDSIQSSNQTAEPGSEGVEGE